MKSALMAVGIIVILSSITPKATYIVPCSKKLETKYYLGGKLVNRYVEEDGNLKYGGSIRWVGHHKLGRFMTDSFVVTQYIPSKPIRIIYSGKFEKAKNKKP